MGTFGATITGMASALPAPRAQADLWDSFFSRHYAGSRWAKRIYDSAGVARRHPAIDPTVEDVSAWTTGARMQRYLNEATPLAKSAASGALAAAGLDATDVGLLTVVSCTGYATPGIDVSLARDLGLSSSTERALLGHMGCHAALPALGLVADSVANRGRPALLLCVELSSLHLQPASTDVSQVLSHALFSDAAVAVVVEPGPSAGGLEVVDLEACSDLASADHITWEITDLGFRMGLSRHVPELLARHVGPAVDRLLGRHGVARSDVTAWGVHPGGLRVLDAIGKALELPDHALETSRQVLRNYGNCSSGTTLLVLEQLRHQPQWLTGDFVVLLAFGPGLTLYALLLQA